MGSYNYRNLISSDLKKRATTYPPRKNVKPVTFMCNKMDQFLLTPQVLDPVAL